MELSGESERKVGNILLRNRIERRRIDPKIYNYVTLNCILEIRLNNVKKNKLASTIITERQRQ